MCYPEERVEQRAPPWDVIHRKYHPKSDDTSIMPGKDIGPRIPLLIILYGKREKRCRRNLQRACGELALN